MARTATDSNACNLDWNHFSLFDSPANVLISIWVNVTSWTTAYQPVFQQVDGTSSYGWQLMREHISDGMVFNTAGSNSPYADFNVNFEGKGWIHIAAFIQSSPSNARYLFVNGSQTDSGAVIGGTFGVNTGSLEVSLTNQIAAEGAAIWSGISYADAKAIVAALAKGFDPLSMPFKPAFYAPVIGRGSTEADVMGTLGTTASPANSTYTAGPRIFRKYASVYDATTAASVYLLSASNSFGLSASVSATHDYNRAAGNSFSLTATAHAPTTINVSAGNSFSLAATSATPNVYLVSASNSIGVSATVGKNADYSRSASNSISLSATVAARFTKIISVSASNSFVLDSVSREYVSPILLTASNTFALSSTGSAPRMYYLSASNSFAMNGDQADEQRLAIWNVSAGNTLAFKATGGEVRDAVVAAGNTIRLSAGARSNRDIYVSASTMMGLFGSFTTKGLYDDAATSTFTLTASADAEVSATLASNSFGIGAYAWAIVELPWRRNALTLPPGGGLPHS